MRRTGAPLDPSLRVLILAPIGRDAALMSQVLRDVGIPNVVCDDTDGLLTHIREGAGAVLVTEEALDPVTMEALARLMIAQPPWSDMPFMILTGQPAYSPKTKSFEQLGPRSNITLIDRPVRMKTLVTTAEAVLRFRRRQYEIRDLMNELEERVQERDRFLAILGHELRNPLGAILLAAQMADPEDGRLDREYVERIERQTRHLTRLVNDLLDLSRVTSGKIVLKKQIVDLKQLIEEALETVSVAASTHKLHLAFECAEDEVLVHGDSTRLDQIVSNVLTNALKYTPSDGHVAVTLRCDAGEAAISVKDDGVGISPERVGGIFELFAQAENAIGRSQGGMGIGLALVRNLVQLHGGRVFVRSDGVGKGSEFTIRLPLVGRDSTEERVGRRPAPQKTEPSTGRRVVIVEDNPDVRELLRLKLKRLGHEVDAAPDGPSGVETIVQQKPDVAFVDIGLPVLDGYEVAQRVRNVLGPDVFLVALSGFGQPEDKRKALDAGFDEHLTKPAEMSDIERVLAARTEKV